jgi:hypothetical protein
LILTKKKAEMEQKLQIVLVLQVLINFCHTTEENYCDPTLCDDGETHTACDHYLVSKFMSQKSSTSKNSKDIL